MLQFLREDSREPCFSLPQSVMMYKAYGSAEISHHLQSFPIFHVKIGSGDNKKGRRSANSDGLNVIVWSTKRGGTNGSPTTGKRLPKVLIVNPSPVAAEDR